MLIHCASFLLLFVNKWKNFVSTNIKLPQTKTVAQLTVMFCPFDWQYVTWDFNVNVDFLC